MRIASDYDIKSVQYLLRQPGGHRLYSSVFSFTTASIVYCTVGHFMHLLRIKSTEY